MKKKKKATPLKPKTELGHKLFAVRKQMNNDLCQKWFGWFQGERPGMSEATFDAISRGDYISKDNVRLAMSALKKGKEMVEQYQLDLEVELNAIG